jgi:zinc protease
VRPGVPIADVERRFFAEIERVRREPVSEAELDKAKRQIEVMLVNGLETSHALAERIGPTSWRSGGSARSTSGSSAIRAVTAADVQRVAQTYLVDDQRSVVHLVAPSRRSRRRRRGGA